MAHGSGPHSIDEYISGFPPETQKVLQELRGLIKAVAPDATEKISYGMPAFDLKGRRLVYFAAWKSHIGFYPAAGDVVEAFEEEFKPYKRGKGSVQFPLDRPLPTDLIRRIVAFRADQNAEKTSKSGGDRWTITASSSSAPGLPGLQQMYAQMNGYRTRILGNPPHARRAVHSVEA